MFHYKPAPLSLNVIKLIVKIFIGATCENISSTENTSSAKPRHALLALSADEEVSSKATQRKRRLEVPYSKPLTAPKAWQGLTHSEHSPGKCKGFGFSVNSQEVVDNPVKAKKGLIHFVKGDTINLPPSQTSNEEAHSPLKEEQVNNFRKLKYIYFSLFLVILLVSRSMRC